MQGARWRSRLITVVMALIVLPLLIVAAHAAPPFDWAKNPLLQTVSSPEAPQTKQQNSDRTVLFEVEGVLEPGDSVLEINGSLHDVYPFEGEAGQTITIQMTSDEFDTYLVLIDAAGQTIGENDDSSFSDTNSTLTVSLPETGTYGIVANAFDDTGRGNYRLTVSVASASESQLSEANRLLQEGIEQFEISQFQGAIAAWQQALDIYQALENRQMEAETLFYLAGAYVSLGQSQQAADVLQPALAITRDINDRQAEALILGLLSVVYNTLGESRQIIELSQQALEIARVTNDRPGELTALINLGSAYQALGQYQRTIEVYQQALEIARDSGDPQSEANTLDRLGLAYDYLGQSQRAIELHQQALAIARNANDRESEGIALYYLGSAYNSLGQYQQAIEVYQQALTIIREGGDRQREAQVLRSLGRVYHALGQYQQAIEIYQQALIIDRDIGDRRNETVSLDLLGDAHNGLGQLQPAIEFYQQSLAIDRDIAFPLGEVLSLNNMGMAFLDAEQFGEAEIALAQSIETLESMRADLPDAQLISIADLQGYAYTNLERALTAQNKVVDALEVTERARARAFALRLASRLANSGEQPAPQARAAIGAPETVNPPSIAEIQQIACDQNATLVTYSLILDQALYIWVVQPTGEIEFRSVEFGGSGSLPNPIATIDGPVYRGAPAASELNTLVTDSRAGIGVVGGIPAERLKELHQVLIDPIADLLPSDPEARVVFVPQGSLFLVPFTALQAADNSYLIETHTVLTAPSIQVLGLTASAQRGTRNFLNDQGALVVGNPVMPDVSIPSGEGLQDIQLAPLPGAETEAIAIGDFLDVSPLLGAQATEAQIKQQLPTASLIHLATHGLLEYGDPQSSGVLDVPGAVALTSGNGEDGLLTAAEILEVGLQAELAVLSACDTGRGRITGDGVIGLSRSLITAGVPSVIVSLWAVPDAPTAALMTEFYRQLQQGQTKAQALRQAMLATLADSPEPVNWAAFTLMGAVE
ncbi:MAG: CHAT domain-containing protein [Cyanobacteria bacterium P01_A01_bin.123]